ncbi:MAG: DUF192 domain-containing protein [Chloroflexota bacterium]
MVAYRVSNTTRARALAERAQRPRNPLTRGIGLIGRAKLDIGEGLIIQPCKSIVMFFMRFPIDVIFVDADGSVCHVVHSIKPWRTSAIVPKARYVVELPAGRLVDTETETGDHIEIEAV